MSAQTTCTQHSSIPILLSPTFGFFQVPSLKAKGPAARKASVTTNAAFGFGKKAAPVPVVPEKKSLFSFGKKAAPVVGALYKLRIQFTRSCVLFSYTNFLLPDVAWKPVL